MKDVIIMLCFILSAMGAMAQMDLPPAGGNPRATISEEVGITSITIKYSRPGMKGRNGKLWGGVVSNGFSTFNFGTNTMSSPWRAGANEATVISFEHDIIVEMKELKAGSYALFMSIEPDSVTIIFSKQTNAWGSFYYKESDDILRIKVKSDKLEKPVEWLKYEFMGYTDTSCVIAMQWEKLSVPFKVSVNVDDLVLSRMREELMGAKGFVSANNLQASAYWFDKKKHMDEAMRMAQRAVTGRPFAQSGFDAYQNLAYGFQLLNSTAQADSVINEGLKIANTNQFIQQSNFQIAQKRSSRAVEIMNMGKQRFGDVYAINNGLSYAYAANKNYKKALEYAGKAYVQAPYPQAKTQISSNIVKLKEGKDIN